MPLVGEQMGSGQEALPVRALVTGGAGFIGSHLVDALRQRGIPVAVLDNLATGRREHVPEGVPLFEVDVGDAAAVLDACEAFRPTHVFHQAAQASVKVSVDDPVHDARVNIMGGLNVLEAARKTGVRHVIFASTGGAIYGDVPEGSRADETWPARPASPYAAGKAAFDLYLDVYRKQYGLTCTSLRYANVYGPRQDPFGEAGVVAIFTSRLLAGEEVTLFARRQPGDDGCVRDYVWVGDVVAANVLAMERGLDGVFNVGTGVGRTTRDVLAAIEGCVGTKARVQPAPHRPGDLERSVLSADRLQQHGWRAKMPFEEGIRRTVAWFRDGAASWGAAAGAAQGVLEGEPGP